MRKILILISINYKDTLTVLRITSGLNLALFDCFQLGHINPFMSVIGLKVISAGIAFRRPQKCNKYTIPINLIVSMRDSIINNKKRDDTRESFTRAFTAEMNHSFIQDCFLSTGKSTIALLVTRS